MRWVFPFAMVFMVFSVFVLLRSPVPMGTEDLASTEGPQCSRDQAFDEVENFLAIINDRWSTIRSLTLSRASNCLLKFATNEPFENSDEENRCKELSTVSFTPSTCSAFLDEISTTVFDAPLAVILDEHYGSTSTSFNENVPTYLNNIFQVRALIHQRLPAMIGQTSVPQMKSCLQSLKNFHQKSRRFEDSLALWYLWTRKGATPSPEIARRYRQMSYELRDNVPLVRNGRSQTEQQSSFARLAFSALEPYTLVFVKDTSGTEKELRGKKFDRLELRSGDILLTQPKTFHHQFLADTLAPGGSFSQAVIVHLDKDVQGKTQTRFLFTDPVRGMVDERDIDGFFEDQVRVLLLRYPDTELALQASHEASFMKSKNDLSFLPDAHQDIALGTLSFINAAYDRAFQTLTEKALSGEKQPPFDLFGRQLGLSGFRIPLFAPEDPKEKQETVRLLFHGDTSTAPPSLDNYSPASLLEFDPRFELIAEWRDYSRIEALNMVQTTLQNLLKWDQDPELNYSWDEKRIKEPSPKNKFECTQGESGNLLCQLNAECPLDDSPRQTVTDLTSYHRACLAAREAVFSLADSLVSFDTYVREQPGRDREKTRWGLNDFLQNQYLERLRACPRGIPANFIERWLGTKSFPDLFRSSQGTD